jgi:hypothetical protein
MSATDRVKGGIGIHASRTLETDRVKGGIGIHASRTH